MKNKNHPEKGLVRGVAINPNTPVEIIHPFLEHVEMVTLLAIDPAIKGQTFQDSAITRFTELKKLCSSVKKEIVLCIDGGVKQDNIATISMMGADVVVSGSALFKGNNPAENIRIMLNSLKSGRN
jgi:ribulose-phosphate 3-epimerase